MNFVFNIVTDGPHPNPYSMIQFCGTHFNGDGKVDGVFSSYIKPITEIKTHYLMDDIAGIEKIKDAATLDAKSFTANLNEWASDLSLQKDPRVFYRGDKFDFIFVNYYLLCYGYDTIKKNRIHNIGDIYKGLTRTWSDSFLDIACNKNCFQSVIDDTGRLIKLIIDNNIEGVLK